MNHKISVIIPSFNRAHLLRRVIPTFIQEFVCEIIIIDDASTDNTPQIVESLILEYPLIKYHRSNIKVRQTGAKNIGISLAKGEYCFFGDDDCILKVGSIKSMLTLAIKYPNSLIASRHIVMENGQNLSDLLEDKIERSNLSLKDFYDKDTLKLNLALKNSLPLEIPFCQSCFLVKTDVARSQKFNESFVMTCFREETDFIMQLCMKGFNVILDNNALMIDLPRLSSHGGSRSVKTFGRHLGEIYNEYLFYSRNAKYIRKIATLNTLPLIRAFSHALLKIENSIRTKIVKS